MNCWLLFVFVFKQKTAYELRISDWSSDVCSSDLDQGRKIDASGAVRDWWTAEDAARFDAQAKAFGAQYATYEAAPGAFINPDLTMGENIADLAGLEVAYDAYHRSLNGKDAPVIDGRNGHHGFLLALAQAWGSEAGRGGKECVRSGRYRWA